MNKNIRMLAIVLGVIVVVWLLIQFFNYSFGVDTNRAKNISAPSMGQSFMGSDSLDEDYYDEIDGYSFNEKVAYVPQTSLQGRISRGYPYPDFNSNNNISDNREFLKTSYQSTISTPDLDRVYKGVKGAITKFEGRIDGDNYRSDNYASISFAVSKSKFDDFETEISKLTTSKLYIKQISTTNYLSQKQRLEHSQEAIRDSIGDTEERLRSRTEFYDENVRRLNAEISSTRQQINGLLKSMKDNPDMSEDLIKLRESQIKGFEANIVSFNLQLNTLKKQYQADISEIKNTKKEHEESLEEIAVQEGEFFDDLETVSGYITIKKISYFEVYEIYSPLNLPLTGLLVIVVVGYIYWRRQSNSTIPKVN